MKVLQRKAASKPRKSVVIDCIGPVSLGFAETFGKTLASIELALPVLVEFKRATIDYMSGIKAMAEMLDNRRNAGGFGAFITASNRWRSVLQQNGISKNLILSENTAESDRLIILAQARTTG
jgi:hypothetical protein